MRKSVSIEVNGDKSDAILLLGREGEAYFLRPPQGDEILEYDNVNSDFSQRLACPENERDLTDASQTILSSLERE